MSNISDFQNAELIINRPGPGEYTDGRFVKGQVLTFKAIASVQQATPKEINMLPEGRRNKEMKVVFTESELIPTDETAQTSGDFFEYKGKTYEVHKVEEWSDETDLPHYKSICIKRDDQEGADRG